MSKTKKIVVIGATGHFGGRICRRIVGEKNTELVVTSRSDGRARLFADELRELDPDATVHAASLNQASTDKMAVQCITTQDLLSQKSRSEALPMTTSKY